MASGFSPDASCTMAAMKTDRNGVRISLNWFPPAVSNQWASRSSPGAPSFRVHSLRTTSATITGRPNDWSNHISSAQARLISGHESATISVTGFFFQVFMRLDYGATRSDTVASTPRISWSVRTLRKATPLDLHA